MERIKTIIPRLRLSVAGKRAFKRAFSIFLIVGLFKIKFYYNFTSHAPTDLSLCHLFYCGMGTSTGYIAGLQPHKVVYYNRMTLVVLQILTLRFTNFDSAFYKFLTPRFTNFDSAFCKFLTPRFTNFDSAFYKFLTPRFTNF